MHNSGPARSLDTPAPAASPSGKPPVRLGIIHKLLIWFVVLMTVYVGATTMMLRRTQAVQAMAEGIVSQNFRVVENSEIMARLLLSLIENAKRYEILGKEEYRLIYLETLERYEKILYELRALAPLSVAEEDLREDQPAPHAPWPYLHAQLLEALPRAMRKDGRLLVPEILTRAEQPGQAGKPPAIFVQEETLNRWLGILTEARQMNRERMHERLVDLEVLAKDVERVAQWGATATAAFGVLGLSLIAYGLHRALRELRRGIRRLGGGRTDQPVRVVSRDELGQLAEAFNRMTKLLKQEEEMRSDFIAMLSHEIRTPLTSIRESVNLIRQGVLGETNERQRRFLEIAGQEAQRLSSLLTRLMQVSSLETGQLQLEITRLDAVQLAQGTVERMQPSAQAKKVELLLLTEQEQAMVNADGENIRQALLNLIGNAIKFSPKGGVVRVTLETTRAEVQICVEDQGPGIPEEEQPLVFRKYYRAQGVRKSVDGAGLGLSISKRILEAHGGRMWLRSGPEGSAFCFALPSAGQTE